MNRWVYRIIIIAVFLAVNFFIIRGIGSILAFVKSGADREQVMAKVLKVNDYYKPVFTWRNLENPGREFLEKNQKEVQRDYADSWYVKNLNFSVNSKKGIADFYTDSSRVNIYRNIDLNKKNNITVHGTTLNHAIDVNFYSADGKLVSFDDNNVTEVYKVYQKDSLIARSTTTSNYKVVMLLEDGFWRIRHMVREQANEVVVSSKDTVVEDLVTREEKKLLYRNKPFYIKGINYYPKDSPWEMFGPKFKDSIIEQDFRKVADLGFNTVRIFVNFTDFGKENVKPEYLEQLRTTLNIAEKQDLKVIVTLFDFFGQYDIINWSITEQHLKGIVAPFKTHKAILAWDVKNEADLDMNVHSVEQVQHWLEFALERIRFYDPNHLVTIGWLHPHPYFIENGTTDFLTFHFYEKTTRFPVVYPKLLKESNKPVVLGEFGLHTWKKAFFGNSEKAQAEHFQYIFKYLEEGEKHFIAWTLYDFPELPKEVFGSLPWRTLPQKNMGILDKNGKPKKVLEVFP